MIKILFFTALLMFVLKGDINAQGNSNVLRQEQNIRIEEKRQEQQEKREELWQRLALKHRDRMTARFEFYYKKLLNLSQGVKARAQKMQEEGKDTSASMDKIDLAQMKLEEAKKKGDEVLSLFESSQNREQAKEAGRDAQSVLSLYREAHRYLREAVNLLVRQNYE